jgi:D-arabinose 1-dehydrogenase-like Zn-dependent alcohol dehydrogenase
MGTRDELERVARLCEDAGIRPEIDALEHARDGFAAMHDGEIFGKIVVRP